MSARSDRGWAPETTPSGPPPPARRPDGAVSPFLPLRDQVRPEVRPVCCCMAPHVPCEVHEWELAW